MRIACLLTLLLTLLLSGCVLNQSQRGNEWPTEFQVKDSAGTVSGFALNIARAEDMGDWVVDWVGTSVDGEGVQTFLYTDPDSWDAYLYLPSRQAAVSALTNDDVTVSFSDGVLSVFVTAPAQDGAADDGDWVLHFAAPFLGAWPSEVALFWDGVPVPCDQLTV